MKNTKKRLAIILMMMMFAICTVFAGCSEGTNEEEPEIVPPVLYRNGAVLEDSYVLSYREATSADFGSAASMGVTAKDYKGNALKVEAEIGDLFAGEYGDYYVVYKTVDGKAQTLEKTVKYTVSGTNPEIAVAQADIGLETVKLDVALTADQFDTVKILYSKKGDEENAVYMNSSKISADESGIMLETSAFTSLLEDGNRDVWLKVYTADWYSSAEVTFADESAPRYLLPELGSSYIVAAKLELPFAERLTLQEFDFEVAIESDACECTATIAEDETIVTVKPTSTKRLALGSYTLSIMAKKNGQTLKTDTMTFEVTDTFAKLDSAADLAEFKVADSNVAEIAYDETKGALKLSKKAGATISDRGQAALQLDTSGSMYKALANYVGYNRFIAFDFYMDGSTSSTINSMLIYTCGTDSANLCYGTWYTGEVMIVKCGDEPSDATRCYGDTVTCGTWYTMYVRAPHAESDGTLIVEDLGLNGFKTLWLKNFRAVDQTETGLAIFPAGYKEEEGDEPEEPIVNTPYPGDLTATDEDTFAMITGEDSLNGFVLADDTRMELSYDETVKALKLSKKDGVYVTDQSQTQLLFNTSSDLYTNLKNHAGANQFLAFDFYMEGDVTATINGLVMYLAGTDNGLGFYASWFDGEVMVVRQGDTSLTRVVHGTIMCGTWYTVYVRCYSIDANGAFLMSQVGDAGFRTIYFQNFRAVEQSETGLGAYRTDELEGGEEPIEPEEPVVNTPYPGDLTATDEDTFVMIDSAEDLVGFTTDTSVAEISYDETVKALKLTNKEGASITSQDQAVLKLDTTSDLYTNLKNHAGANQFLAFDFYMEGDVTATINGLVMYTATGDHAAGLYASWFDGEVMVVRQGDTSLTRVVHGTIMCGTWYTVYVRCYSIDANGAFLMSQVGDAGFRTIYFQNFRAVEQSETGLGAYRTDELAGGEEPEEPVVNTPYAGALTKDENTLAMFDSEESLNGFTVADGTRVEIFYDETMKALKLSKKEGAEITDRDQAALKLDTTSEVYTAFDSYAASGKFIAFDFYIEGDSSVTANSFMFYTGPDSGFYATWYTGEVIIVKCGDEPSENTRCYGDTVKCGTWYTVYVRAADINGNGMLIVENSTTDFRTVYFQNFRAVEQSETGLGAY